jgi:protein-S-isoprenylcysteine O-methyltransferase Ste14
MSFVPAFEIGLWNAWLLIIPLIIYWILGVKFLFSNRMPNYVPPSDSKEKILSNILLIVMFGSFIYSVFMPLNFGTIWFSVGLIVYFAGLVLITISMINFATTPLDKPVIKGVYRFSRNPMFLGWFLIYFGIAIVSLSWVYVLITILFIIIVNISSPFEEDITLEHYGNPYKEYMKRTPKWIGFPKSKKKQ